ncbi:hypothetical protein [Nonomuraea sp. NPDC048916]|uniref:hypothetical protein n=1 Tax=Nonomuraea sp. NPDC048916 TaxID=3154232 RepID=UPI0033EDF632
MTPQSPQEELPRLLPEVEQQALIGYVSELLTALPLDELHAAIDRLAGPGAAAAVVLERRRRALDSQRWLQAQREEWVRRDPEAVARAEDWARRLLAGEFTVRGEDLIAADAAAQA